MIHPDHSIELVELNTNFKHLSPHGFWLDTYLWTSLIPPAPPRGWLLYDIECGGNGCGGPVVVWPRGPGISDWGCWEEACWPEPTWTDRIAASISFRRCHHFTYFVSNFFILFFSAYKETFLLTFKLFPWLIDFFSPKNILTIHFFASEELRNFVAKMSFSLLSTSFFSFKS